MHDVHRLGPLSDVARHAFVGGLGIVLSGLVLEVIQRGARGEPAIASAEQAARTPVDTLLAGVSAGEGLD